MVLIQPLSSLLTEVVWPAGWVDSDPLKVQSYLSKPTLPCSVLMNVFLLKVIRGSGYSLKIYKYLKTKMFKKLTVAVATCRLPLRSQGNVMLPRNALNQANSW